MSKTKKKENQKVVFCSVDELRRSYTPDAFKEEIEEKKEKQPREFGSQLATRILKVIRDELEDE